MATGKALDGKPYAGNPHVRFDEGEVAPCTVEASLRRVPCRRQPEGRASGCAATPRRGSLLYKMCRCFMAAVCVVACGMINANDNVLTKAAMPIRSPWPAREQEKRNQITKSGGSIDLVFVGDSITHGWENEGRGKNLYDTLRKTYSILNLGYSGNCTQNIIWRLENGELDGYKAKLFMVMAGTNNVEPPEEVAVGVRRILDLIRSRQPQAKILLLPIFPRGESAADARNAKNAKVNEIIQGFADGVHILWCDFTSELRDSAGGLSGNLSQDRLHLNEAGFAIWLKHVLPHFERTCGK